MALLHGKLSREQENLEDLLTSSVFGLLKYLPPEEALLPLLERAQLLEGASPLSSLPAGTRAKYEFWPSLRGPDGRRIEPDLLLELEQPDGTHWYMVIEAKLHSGKSSAGSESDENPGDQLARQWVALEQWKREDARRLLVYLTAHFGMPVDELKASTKAASGAGAPMQCAWLSWRHVAAVCQRKESPMLEDLAQFLERMGLIFFEGMKGPERRERIPWRFRPSPFHFLPYKAPSIEWRFSQ